MSDGQATKQRFAEVKELSELYPLLAEAGMGPGWNKSEPSLYPAPKKTFVPAHWTYETARAALAAAAPLVSTELAERRNLILANPVPGNTYATARTMVAAYQMVRAGEAARSHRHTPNALRLVVEADPGTYTIVQGKKIPMHPGDVLLTPNWLWHGHSNESAKDAFWIDFLDAPLVQLLEPMFFEHFAEGVEKAEATDENSPMRFAWSETKARLDQSTPNDDKPHEVQLGDPALDSMALFVQRLSPGRRSPVRQTTENNVYAVIDGEGATEIDGETFRWKAGDVFVAPAWREHTHESPVRSHLLRVSDAPVMNHFRWLKQREQ
jgi:gentisate 1,2-dioxygenase